MRETNSLFASNRSGHMAPALAHYLSPPTGGNAPWWLRMQHHRAALDPVLETCARHEGIAALPCVSITKETDDLLEISAAADRLLQQPLRQMLVLGTGGSSLAGRTLAALQPVWGASSRPRLSFIDNADPHTLAALTAECDWHHTGLLIISKSGQTIETLSQALILVPVMERAIGKAAMAERVVVITEPGARPLRGLAEHFGLPIIDHPPGVGGRFSAFSAVGLLPAMLAGLDPRAIRAGGADSVSPLALTAPADGAAWQVALQEMGGRRVQVMMPYTDRLRAFTDWHQQVWAESLGKEGKGTTPLPACGTVDQHSLLQLIAEGPDDKAVTFIALENHGAASQKLHVPEALHPTPVGLHGRSLEAIMHAQLLSCREVMQAHNVPWRQLTLPKLDAYSIGALVMHCFMETFFTAYLLQIDAFNQPAVESIKLAMRAQLQQP